VRGPAKNSRAELLKNDDAAPAPYRLDPTDESIIAQLQEDGRRPSRTIARALGISEPTLRWRLRRLLESGVLRIAAIADPFRLGYAIQAAILLKVTPGVLERVVEELAAWPEVMYVSSCTGRVDVYVQVVCRNQQDLWRLLAVRLPAVGGIVETETLIELRVHKLAYVYPGLGESAKGIAADGQMARGNR
jgi:Lrp/AsnC family transcriptional regulator, regulator for asnA, asnC and gidA